MKTKQSITVGIPTCYGGVSLVETVRSIRSSRGGARVKILVVADTRPLGKRVKGALRSLKVRVIENKHRGTQISKLKQMVKRVDTDLFISTQDDVRFHTETISLILQAFKNDRNLTMVGTRVLPEKPSTMFERVIQVGAYTSLIIGMSWKNGQNYLMANGRCLAFRSKMYKKMHIPENIVNLDAYFFFENNRLGGSFLPISNAYVYNKTPLRLTEHKNQNNRFRNSFNELYPFFGKEIKKEYEIPSSILTIAVLESLATYSWYAVLYFVIYLYTYVIRFFDKSYINALWKADLSTKRV